MEGTLKTAITASNAICADLDGRCHRLHHCMATAMLENGADIRYIQTQLGHASLKSTQIYTQVTNLKLKEVHSKTYPTRLSRQDDDQEPEG